MIEFTYEELFPLNKDTTDFRLLSKEYISVRKFEGSDMITVDPEGLTFLTELAFKEVSHLLRPAHLESLSKILSDPESSDNDTYVARELIKNAVISAEGIFPMCQDTGTAIVMGKKGHQIWTGGSDEAAISKGVFNAYTKNNFRYSQNAPLTMYDEVNTGCNLPAQIELYSARGDEYRFLFIAKGGGSANKTYLYQETKAILDPKMLIHFLNDKMKTLGTAACPPYHLTFVIGGLSAEMTLKTVKLASTGYLDHLPATGSLQGRAFRDRGLEDKVLELSRILGIGAQFGGKYFCHDVRVVRLPRHGASCPVGIGVSCSADRNIKAKITRDGIFLERLEADPSKYLPQAESSDTKSVPVDLNQPMSKILAVLDNCPVATRLLLTGNIIVARDIAHAKLKERIERGEELPQYFKDHVIYYAGPAKTPHGYASGSFGPTTAGRMDSYVPLFQKQGGSLIMLAKGNRSKMVTQSCREFGGFYLGSIGGPAARLGRDCITDIKTIEYPELGMEAIFMISVKDFPAFVIIDNKGNDFFEKLL